MLTLDLPADVDAVPAARSALDGLASLVSPPSLQDARLMVSELVTNSVRHGELARGQVIELTADITGGVLRIQVRDRGKGFVLKPRTAGSADDAGWGLYLVARLSDRWGVSSDGATSVWFELAADRTAAVDPETAR